MFKALNESGIDAWSRAFPLRHMVNIYHETPKNGIFSANSTNFTDVTYASRIEPVKSSLLQ